MSEFVIKIEDEIVQALGKQTIEQYLQHFITQAILKVAALELLKDYQTENLNEDKDWQMAQKRAFQKDHYSTYIKVYANV